MDNSNNTTINSLLPHDGVSEYSDFDLNILRKQFDTNYQTWKLLLPGDPQRKVLATENEQLLIMIIGR